MTIEPPLKINSGVGNPVQKGVLQSEGQSYDRGIPHGARQSVETPHAGRAISRSRITVSIPGLATGSWWPSRT